MPVKIMIVRARVSCVQCILVLKEVLKKGLARKADVLVVVLCMRPIIVV